MGALILYTSLGSGHRRVAETLAAALRDDLGWSVTTADLLHMLSSRLPQIANSLSGQMLNMKMASHVYERYWADDEVLRTLDRVLDLTNVAQVVRDCLADAEATVCLCTHALPARILSRLWLKDGRYLPTLNILTDYMVNGFWPVAEVDAYVVASTAAQKRLIRRGYPAECIYPLGIPIGTHFATPVADKRALRQRLDLNNAPMLLAVTGSWQIEPYLGIAQWVYDLFNYWRGAPPAGMQVVVVTGQNGASRTALQRMADELPFPVRLLGLVDTLADWMHAADLLLTKPGGLTLAEALACRLPMVLAATGPGQERANVRVLVEQGCAVEGAAKTAVLAAQIEKLLADVAGRQAMQAACAALARPDAAHATALLVDHLVAERATGLAALTGA